RKRAAHAAAWEAKARAFVSSGDYEWMAGLLPGAGGRLLQIGTGAGGSTLALRARGWRIVAVDENDACLTATKGPLGRSVQAWTIVKRRRPLETGPGEYVVAYEDFERWDDLNVVPVEGDVLDDPRLPELVLARGPLDAAVAWLVDTHDARMAHAK